MIFHEIYSAYYACVAAILTEAQRGTLTRSRMNQIVQEKGFADSSLVIPQKLRDGSWPLLNGNFETPILHAPKTPLSLLQKRWLKALLLDPRIRLFGVTEEGLEDVEPLFRPEMFVWYDRYTDGDPYGEERYTAHFRTMLCAVREGRPAKVLYRNRRGEERRILIFPRKLEYSLNDDKFRVVYSNREGQISYINMARIQECSLEEAEEVPVGEKDPAARTEEIELLLVDRRNTLERFMLQFAYLQKETERTGDGKYRVVLHYRKDDEPEIRIRLLSFGPVIRVLKPETLIESMRQRIRRQLEKTGI